MRCGATVVGSLIVLGAVLLILPLYWGFWIPDAVNPRVVVLDALLTENGDYLRLTQLWVGDGYATEFFHTDKKGEIWTLAIDGDARKAWRGSLLQTGDVFSIQVLNHRFFYDIQSNFVIDAWGRTQMLEHFPAGTPIVPPR
jgi:hypothetical protein